MSGMCCKLLVAQSVVKCCCAGSCSVRRVGRCGASVVLQTGWCAEGDAVVGSVCCEMLVVGLVCCGMLVVGLVCCGMLVVLLSVAKSRWSWWCVRVTLT